MSENVYIYKFPAGKTLRGFTSYLLTDNKKLLLWHDGKINLCSLKMC